jgi:hypothetical protein
MSKALKTAGAIIGGVALVATGIGAVALAVGGGVGLGAGLAAAASASIAGISMQTLAAAGAGLSFLGDATAKPLKVGGSAGTQVDFAADPNAPIPYPIGRTGTGGRIIYATTGEAKNRNILYCTVLGGGAPLHAITGFKANDEAVEFGPLQQALGGTYANRMWQNRQLGAMPSPAFGPPNTTDAGVLSEWTSAHKLSGYMASWHVLGYDQKTYSTGVPKAVWTIEGACVYDPRQDSTYPGGSGAHRVDDPATWTFSENPWLNALAWCLGRYANGVRVLGIGARKELIDIAAFVEGANIADANGWKIGGVVYSNDSKWDVLKAMCQAGGGRPIQLGASITALVNAPRVSLATLTADDLAGGYTVQAAQSVRGRPNQIIPKYRSEDHGWEMVAAGPVKVAAYVTADRNRLRSREVSYPLVQDARQAAQLAAYDLVNARELGPVSVTCKPAWMGYKRGDCITVDVPDLGLNGQKALILARTIDPMTGEVTLVLQSETDTKHDFALGRTGSPPPVPGLTAKVATPPAPSVYDWVATGATLTDNGVSVPAIVIVGSSDNPQVERLLVRYRPTGAPTWVAGSTIDLLDDGDYRVELSSGLTPETTYNVQIAYRSVLGAPSDWTDLDDVVAGSFAFDTLGTTDGLLTVYYQATAPTSPERGDVWFKDAAGTDPRQWDGDNWVDASNNAAVQAILFATAAQAKANSKIKVYYQTSAPTAETVGDLWVDTDDPSRRVFRWSGSAWQQIADQTGFNIAAGIAGQGSLATQNWVVWATQVTGVGRPEDYANRVIVYRQTSAPSSPGINDIWVQLNGSGVAIAMWAYNGSSWINGADRTIYNIAAGFSGQGSLATQNSVSTFYINPNAVSRVAYGEAVGTMYFGGSESSHFGWSYTSEGGAHLVTVYAEIGVGTGNPTAGAIARIYCNGSLIGGVPIRCEGNWSGEGRAFPVVHTPGAGSCYYSVTYQETPGSGPVKYASKTAVTVAELKR